MPQTLVSNIVTVCNSIVQDIGTICLVSSRTLYGGVPKLVPVAFRSKIGRRFGVRGRAVVTCSFFLRKERALLSLGSVLCSFELYLYF